MGAYIIRRLIAMFAMLVLLSLIVFLLFAARPQVQRALRAESRATRRSSRPSIQSTATTEPVHVQYGRFVKGIVARPDLRRGQGGLPVSAPCLGYSFLRNEDVTTLIKETLPVTAQLALGGFRPLS